MQSLLIATVVNEFEVSGSGIFLGPIIEEASITGLPAELEVIAVAYGWCTSADPPLLTVNVRGPDGRDSAFERGPDWDDAPQLQPVTGSDLQNFLGTWSLVLKLDRPGVYFVDIQLGGEQPRSHPIAISADPSLEWMV